ncbi:MAG: hypothetical protein U1F43_26330 [Myxococcota bacterium]
MKRYIAILEDLTLVNVFSHEPVAVGRQWVWRVDPDDEQYVFFAEYIAKQNSHRSVFTHHIGVWRDGISEQWIDVTPNEFVDAMGVALNVAPTAWG